jgi:ion channel
MLSKLLSAWGLMALCVVIHAGGVTSALQWIRQSSRTLRFWRQAWLFITVAGWMIVLHLTEIGVWAFLYVRKGAIADFQSALYFSAITYTTTGYGDIVLPAEWRLVGGVEALTGILMCGWSTGFFFAIVSRLYEGAAASTSDRFGSDAGGRATFESGAGLRERRHGDTAIERDRHAQERH